jgi:O-antigen/teichoic acid export membrane protein
LSWTESASVHINDEEGRDAFFSNVAKNTLRIFSSLGVLVIAILPLAFNIIIGEEYHDAYNYIPIAVVAVLLNCMVSIYSAVYVAKKMTKKVASTSICSAAINIVVDLLLVHFIGIYAAVISSAVAYLVMVVYRHFDIKNYVKIKYQASEIILATLGVVGISAIYYFGGFYVYIIGVIFATLYTIIMNRKILKKIFTSIKKTIR